MSGTCSVGHPWVEGAPACRCDAVGVPETAAPILVESPRDELPRTAAAPRAAATAVIAPATAAPILSDDGWWQWDGSAWVPADVPPIPAIPSQPGSTDLPTADDEPSTTQPPTRSEPLAAYPSAAYPPPAAYAPPGTYPPPGHVVPAYGGAAYGAAPQGGRDGLAVAALVCSLIPIFAVAQLLALIFAIIVLTRVGRTGQKGQVMAIFAIGVSVLMFFISAAIAIPVFLNQRQSGYDTQTRIALRDTANAEETYFVENGTFADAAQLNATGGTLPAGIELDVEAGGSAGYCLAAGRSGGTRWLMYDSFHGGLQTTIFTSPEDAIAACASTAGVGATGSGGSSGSGTATA